MAATEGGTQRYDTRSLRIARVAVALPLIGAAALAAWFGGFIAAYEFTGGYDSPYLLIGSPFVAVGVGAAAAAWLLLRDALARWRPSGPLFAVLVFTLPVAVGIATRIYQGVISDPPPYRHATHGYTVARPRAIRTLLPEGRPDHPDGAIAMLTWAGFAQTDPVPPGGLKVRIGPAGSLPAPPGTPFVVGEGRYRGTISYGTPPGEADRPIIGNGHPVAITYEAGGRTWRILGVFAEPPDRANPNAAVFFAIAASVRHEW